MNIARRQFLKLAAGGALWCLAGSRDGAALPYRVGIRHASDPYEATRQAVAASGAWPAEAIAGRTVVIKPNLMSPEPSETGITTDPQVVRALVDLALEARAAQVRIVEGGPPHAKFAACGYAFLSNYDPQGRVALVDLTAEPVSLVRVPDGGLAYTALYMPTLLLADDVVFISAAKLKCHNIALATLTMKNLMGLAPAERYQVPPGDWRFAMHQRGINQAIVDLNLVRPIDFAVIDGIWAMEGDGPATGDRVRMDLILAGRNALAVDRVGLMAMDISQERVQHLSYAATRVLGPSDVAMVEAVGDPLPSYSFAQPDIPPILEVPQCTPAIFDPLSGEQTRITYGVDQACRARVDIVRAWDTTPAWELVRTLHGWSQHPGGSETVTWDGRDTEGTVVPAGHYMVRIMADTGEGTRESYATSWVQTTFSGEFEMRLPFVSRSQEVTNTSR